MIRLGELNLLDILLIRKREPDRLTSGLLKRKKRTTIDERTASNITKDEVDK